MKSADETYRWTIKRLGQYEENAERCCRKEKTVLQGTKRGPARLVLAVPEADRPEQRQRGSRCEHAAGHVAAARAQLRARRGPPEAAAGFSTETPRTSTQRPKRRDGKRLHCREPARHGRSPRTGMGVESCSSRTWRCTTGRRALQPFALLDQTPVSQRGESVVKLAAPSLLNDYYTNLLDCSCSGVVALALGSSVYLWSSETRALKGSLDLSPLPGRRRHRTPAVSCLSWSSDGSALCIGTRRGEIQLWDVEHKRNMSCLPSHLSVVRGLSWKQQLLSSGSALGRIHHLDPRAPAAPVGVAVQEDGVCGLQWAPGGDRLASGSTGGLLRIWGGGVAGVTRSRQPITTMRQPSAVKAMGWCPWQRKIIATGGGWNDGELRVWDTDSGTCVTSANTNSQICSLRWAEQKKRLVTGHGLPHHQVHCWSWESCSLRPVCQVSGHSQRVLHLAVNPDGTQIFSAGADQQFHIWDASSRDMKVSRDDEGECG